MQTNPMLLAGKVLLTIMWVAAAGSLFMPGDAMVLRVLRLIFWGTLGVHLVECAIFFKPLQKTGRPLAPNLVQILLYGVVHWASVQKSAPSDEA